MSQQALINGLTELQQCVVMLNALLDQVILMVTGNIALPFNVPNLGGQEAFVPQLPAPRFNTPEANDFNSPDRSLGKNSKNAIKNKPKIRKQCSKCLFWFANSYSLNRHLKKIHSDPKIFRCVLSPEKCSFTAQTFAGMTRHFQVHVRHGETRGASLEECHIAINAKTKNIVFLPDRIKQLAEEGTVNLELLANVDVRLVENVLALKRAYQRGAVGGSSEQGAAPEDLAAGDLEQSKNKRLKRIEEEFNNDVGSSLPSPKSDGYSHQWYIC